MAEKNRNRVAFSVPPELRQRAEAVMQKIRDDSTPRAHALELVEVIIELTNTGLHSYFLAPLERIGVGTLALGTARVGVATAGKSLPTIVRHVVGNMTDEQLLELVAVMDEMMV